VKKKRVKGGQRRKKIALGKGGVQNEKADRYLRIKTLVNKEGRGKERKESDNCCSDLVQGSPPGTRGIKY